VRWLLVPFHGFGQHMQIHWKPCSAPKCLACRLPPALLPVDDSRRSVASRDSTIAARGVRFRDSTAGFMARGSPAAGKQASKQC
jgi:hypothetical protein